MSSQLIPVAAARSEVAAPWPVSTFALAAIGSVVWLNNFSQFPVLMQRHGGVAFLAVYLLALALVAAPLMSIEILLGKLTGRDAVGGLYALGVQARLGRYWRVLGFAIVLSAFCLFSYYAVIGGWSIALLARAFFGTFDGVTLDGAANIFGAFAADPEKQLFWYSLFTGSIILVSARDRIGQVVRLGVPALFIGMALFVVYSASLPDFAVALELFMRPDFGKLGADALMLALGQAFFGVSIAIGSLAAYGVRLRQSAYPVPRLVSIVLAADVIAALLAGLMLLPVMTTAGYEPPNGPSLIFQYLPVAFDQVPFGVAMRLVFFALVLLALWLSGLSFFEPLVLAVAGRFQLSRARAAAYVGAVCWLTGVVAVLSFSHWAFGFEFFGLRKSFGVFDVLVLLTNLLLPAVSLILLLLAGWGLHRSFSQERLALVSPCAYDVWLWSARVIAPLAIVLIVFYLPRLFL